jgi:hypothetical protein
MISIGLENEPPTDVTDVCNGLDAEIAMPSFVVKIAVSPLPFALHMLYAFAVPIWVQMTNAIIAKKLFILIFIFVYPLIEFERETAPSLVATRIAFQKDTAVKNKIIAARLIVIDSSQSV